MAEPDPSDDLIRLENLITSDLHTHIDPMNRAAVIGWGLFFNVAHQIRAVLTLHQAGACGAASPNRRSALEYAITLRWCVDQGDRIGDIYNRKLGNDQIQLAKALKADGTKDRYTDAYKIMADTVETVRKTIAPDANERLVKIDNLFKGYALANVWSFYTVESRFTHPTPTSAQLFFKTEGDAFHVSQAPLHEEMVACQLFCLWIFHFAMLAFNEVLTGTPWTSELERIAKDYGFETTLPQWQGPGDLNAQ
ncbi:DUF5677 domain-containing protein [Streptomyces sp. NPDC096032]|uniref:DUF5677 domain-containing protein n=1 Tax=Streptomyces sp. NPDC096032 TaxID=3366070 RepID=UPI0038130F07